MFTNNRFNKQIEHEAKSIEIGLLGSLIHLQPYLRVIYFNKANLELNSSTTIRKRYIYKLLQKIKSCEEVKEVEVSEYNCQVQRYLEVEVKTIRSGIMTL
jgi:hypothetical protein